MRLLCRSLVAFLVSFLAAAAPAQQTPPLAGIAHVAIRVHDLAASIAFYESLGFVEAFDLKDKQGNPTEAFIKIDDRQFLELYPVSAKEPDAGFLHLCFEGDDLDAIHDDYVSHGLTPIAVRKAGAGNMLFTMPGPLQPIGPDGKAIPQNIEYTQYMPGSLHSKDFGQHLGADRVADKLLGVALAMTDPDGARNFYINQLSFKPLPGEPMTMHLPGNSGEEVQIVPPALGRRARITLEAANLGRAGRKLGHEHIKFEKGTELLGFTDPDGNQILIRQR
jgi:catechol 2,3-dioxygenase-like lactoylglutathione lyase family enzyme